MRNMYDFTIKYYRFGGHVSIPVVTFYQKQLNAFIIKLSLYLSKVIACFLLGFTIYTMADFSSATILLVPDMI